MQTEIIEQIIHLPITERMEIIEKISRSVREDLRRNDSENSVLESREKAYQHLRGIVAVEVKTSPTDEQMNEDFMNYLSEEHS